MGVVTVNIKRKYLEQIIDNTKVVEGRLGTERFRNVDVGDWLKFRCGADVVYRQTKQITMYENFKEMLSIEGLQHCLPGVCSISQGVKIYEEFYDSAATVGHKVLAFRWSDKDFGQNFDEMAERPKRRCGQKVPNKKGKLVKSTEMTDGLKLIKQEPVDVLKGKLLKSTEMTDGLKLIKQEPVDVLKGKLVNIKSEVTSAIKEEPIQLLDDSDDVICLGEIGENKPLNAMDAVDVIKGKLLKSTEMTDGLKLIKQEPVDVLKGKLLKSTEMTDGLKLIKQEPVDVLKGKLVNIKSEVTSAIKEEPIQLLDDSDDVICLGEIGENKPLNALQTISLDDSDDVICVDDFTAEKQLTKKGITSSTQPSTSSQIQHEQLENDADTDEEDDEDDSHISEKRSIKWISSGRTYRMPTELWNSIYINQEIPTDRWTHFKNKIGDDFDKKFHCILILSHKNVGKRVISMHGKCKHDGCRQYHLKFNKRNMINGQSPSFLVRYSQIDVQHGAPICRQMRGITKEHYEEDLKVTKPATLARDLIIAMDEEQYDDGNTGIVKSESALGKVRQNKMSSSDLAKEDFEDMIKLQKETASDKYIAKVISPFAVYMHSEVQYKVLEEYHRRLKPGEEAVGYLDATGNVAKVSAEVTTHPIMYYPLLIPLKPDPTDKTHLLFPVTDCLNSSHGGANISSWLSDFNGDFIKECPTIHPTLHRIMSDFSYANFHGVLHAFQSMRIQQYIYICYKYAIGLNDFSELKNITKLEMCKTHITKSFAGFVRKYYPSKVSTKKTCYEQKFILEVICSMIMCRSYKVLKEIFRNLAVIILSKVTTTAAFLAKQALISLCTSDATLDGDIEATYKYDELIQSDMDAMSECTTVFEYNESVLKLPIYQSSSFYYDLKHIYDEIMAEVDGDEKEGHPVNDEIMAEVDGDEKEVNNFHNLEIIPEFLKQFGGILPFWTSLTIPKNNFRRSLMDKFEDGDDDDDDDNNIEVEIKRRRGNNQMAESHMNIVKSLMKEKQLNLGCGKLRPSRFVKLLRPLILSHAKRYLLKVRRTRLNYGPEKDNSKVKKRIVRHIIQRKVHQKKLKKLKKIDATSIKDSKESWNKRAARKKHSYFNKKTLLSDNLVKVVTKIKKPASKKPASKRPASKKPASKKSSGAKSQTVVKTSNAGHSLDASLCDSGDKSSGAKSQTVVKTSNAGYSLDASLCDSGDKSSGAKSQTVVKTSNAGDSLDASLCDSGDKSSGAKSQTVVKTSNAGDSLDASLCDSSIGDVASHFGLKRTLDSADATSSDSKRLCVRDTKAEPSQSRPNNGLDISRKDATFEPNTNNGLLPSPEYYLRPSPCEYVVAKLHNVKLSIDDYHTMKSGSIMSLTAMKYIFEYMLPPSYVNLTQYATQIVQGVDELPFTIRDKRCYMPVFKNKSWHLYFINLKSRTFTYYNPSGENPMNFCFFFDFMKSYNASPHHKSKLRTDDWKKYDFVTIHRPARPEDTGIHVIHAAYRFLTEKTLTDKIFNVEAFRTVLLNEILKFSDDMKSLCLLCGEEEDKMADKSIDWSMCPSCMRWIHDACLGRQLGADKCPPCT